MKKRIKINQVDGWIHCCKGGEICSFCGKVAEVNEERIWESAMDQDNLYCKDCAKKEE